MSSDNYSYEARLKQALIMNNEGANIIPPYLYKPEYLPSDAEIVLLKLLRKAYANVYDSLDCILRSVEKRRG